MMTALWIAGGGALGTLARYGLTGLIDGGHRPWGTVLVNVLGSLVLGVAVGIWGLEHDANHQLAVSIGVLGGFTTFSTFALDTVSLWETGAGRLAVATVSVSVLAGVAAVLAGVVLGRAVAST